MNNKDIARKALEIGAIKIDPVNFFRELNTNKPIYTELGNFLHNYDDRWLVIESLVDIIGEKCNGIATISDSGASIATSLVEHYSCDYIFLRDRSREYEVNEGDRIDTVKTTNKFYLDCVYDESKLIGKEFILVDSILSKGQAVFRAISALRLKEIKCNKFLCIFNIGYKGTRDRMNGIKVFNDYGQKLDPKVEVSSVFDLETILDVAVEDGRINSGQAGNIRFWRDNYYGWRRRYGLYSDNYRQWTMRYTNVNR